MLATAWVLDGSTNKYQINHVSNTPINSWNESLPFSFSGKVVQYQITGSDIRPKNWSQNLERIWGQVNPPHLSRFRFLMNSTRIYLLISPICLDSAQILWKFCFGFNFLAWRPPPGARASFRGQLPGKHFVYWIAPPPEAKPVWVLDTDYDTFDSGYQCQERTVEGCDGCLVHLQSAYIRSRVRSPSTETVSLSLKP